MDVKLLLLFRSLGLLLTSTGHVSEATALGLLVDAAEAGHNVDAAMAEVARKIGAGESIDWELVKSQVEAASAELHAPKK
jgi:hypothetical protein